MSYNGSSDTSSINDGEDENWITWFCSLAGNQLFCEIDKSFIIDSFNLFGLKNFIGKDYNGAIDIILDRTDIENEEISRAAAILYGLIHARYIITAMGLEAMHTKYALKEFGECPRALCRGQAVVPMGFSDEPRQSSVKLFCPLCQESYQSSPSFRHIDGAYFSTTFPHLFFMTYEDALPVIPLERYTPKVFGFKIHETSKYPRGNFNNNNDENSENNNESQSPSTINSISRGVQTNEVSSSFINSFNNNINYDKTIIASTELEVAQILASESISTSNTVNSVTQIDRNNIVNSESNINNSKRTIDKQSNENELDSKDSETIKSKRLKK